MTEKQLRFYKLKHRLGKSRELNHKEVVEEEKTIHGLTNDTAKRKREYQEQEEKRRAEDAEAKKDKTAAKRAKLLNTSAREAQDIEERKKKNPAPSGVEVFNQDTLYTAYEKRLQHLPALRNDDDAEVPANKAQKDSQEDLSFDKDSLAWGNAHKPKEAAVNRMIDELKEREEKRKTFSRRRVHYADADVSSINERNENFNKKIARYYNKFTQDIKASLERGTAL
eukprot:GCRY01000595.1.p1 GENE.GCRY01000595.1~~GCRY01000595.1.p1  ORF type:complete len:225 (+),score=60.66 GCRY01000595.1:326-1000(+)